MERSDQLAIILFTCALLSISSAGLHHLPVEIRRMHLDHPEHIHEIIAVDKIRHLSKFNNTTVGFPVQESVDAGFYTTTLKLGTPPQNYTVSMRAESDLFWLTSSRCGPYCTRFPGTAAVYDPVNSSSASGVPKSFSNTTFSVHYRDGDESSGYLTQDLLYMDIDANFSVDVVFGLSTAQSGSLLWADKPMDGILGLGPGNLSLISQLAVMNITRNVFSHCFTGRGNGGGLLTFGEPKVKLPGMVYTPLVPSQSNYIVNMQGVEVGGRALHIDPSISAIIDFGTAMVYFPEKVFKPLVSAVTATVSSLAVPVYYSGLHCYNLPKSTSIDVFPPVSLRIKGNISITMKPKHYLLNYDIYNISKDETSWCLGFQESPTNITILGDIGLQDKLLEYDYDQQRIGFLECNCLKPYSTERNHGMLIKILMKVCTIVLIIIYLLVILIVNFWHRIFV